MNGVIQERGPEMDPAKPFKVVELPTALAACSVVPPKVRVIAQCETLEAAQEARYFEDVDEPAPDKAEFRHFVIIEFRGWGQPYKVLS